MQGCDGCLCHFDLNTSRIVFVSNSLSHDGASMPGTCWPKRCAAYILRQVSQTTSARELAFLASTNSCIAAEMLHFWLRVLTGIKKHLKTIDLTQRRNCTQTGKHWKQQISLFHICPANMHACAHTYTHLIGTTLGIVPSNSWPERKQAARSV